MTSYAYRLLNVFAKGEPFSGNPLCVFEDAAELDGTTMQALAKQFNLSETTFILPSQAGTARVRIFTPDYEMPFAGHPTLGTAAVVASRRGALDAVTLEMTAGLIPVRRFGSLWTLTAKAPAYREAPGAGTAAAALLGVDENAIGDHPVFVDTGREQLIVPFRDPAAVRAARPNPAKPAPELLCDDNHLHLQIWAPSGGARIEARFFFDSGASLLEDPATGSACANLGGWMLRYGSAPLPAGWLVDQGAQTGRPSELHLTLTTEGAIHVGGRVVEIGRGTVSLP